MTVLEIAARRRPFDNKILLIFWVILAILILLIDYVTGPFIQFPFLFVLPVVFSSWYNGREWGIGYAVILSLVRLYFNTIWNVPWGIAEGAINALIRMSVLSLLAYLVDSVAKQTTKTESKVKLLEGLLPICASCKKIRNEKNEWQQLESYITKHSEASFTHGVCPDCAKKLYGFDTSQVSQNPS